MQNCEMDTPKPPFATFRVYPDKKRRFYFKVIVFSTPSQMEKYERDGVRGFPGKKPKEFAALTLPYECIVGSKESKREIGTILFHRLRTGTGIVSHEMTHAALHYFRIKNDDKADFTEEKAEELLAQTVGDLTRQFFMRY